MLDDEDFIKKAKILDICKYESHKKTSNSEEILKKNKFTDESFNNQIPGTFF